MPRDHPSEDPRPAKRLRLPDGFLPTKPKGQRNVLPLPKFSDFHNSFASSSTGITHHAAPARRPTSAAFVIPGKPSSDAPPKPKPKLKVLKPPVLAPPLQLANKSTLRDGAKPMTTAPLLRPIIPPAQPVAGPSKHPVRSILHNPRLIPRPSTPPESKTGLKPLPPPPPLAKRKNDVAKPAVTSIMQTRIARATDIRTEQGTAEILSIFLRHHGSGFVDPVEREMKRGLEQSPEKRNKAKGVKFLRGGLAEAASRQLNAANTNQLLWETDLARLIAKGRSMKPDLHMRITSLVCASPLHTGNPKSPHAPCLVFLRGTVLSSDTLDIRRGDISALFRLSEHDVSTGRKMLTLEEGRDVHVWRPWTYITCSTDGGGEDAQKQTEIVWCFSRFNVFEPKRRVPAPFPMPLPDM